MKQKLMELERETDKSTIIAGDFGGGKNTHLTFLVKMADSKTGTQNRQNNSGAFCSARS